MLARLILNSLRTMTSAFLPRTPSYIKSLNILAIFLRILSVKDPQRFSLKMASAHFPKTTPDCKISYPVIVGV